MINKAQFNNSASGGGFRMWLWIQEKAVWYFFSNFPRVGVSCYKLLIYTFGIKEDREKAFVSHQIQLVKVSTNPMLKFQLKNKAAAL